MAMMCGQNREVLDLLREIGIAPLACVSLTIHIATDDVVTVTPRLVLDSAAMPALQRVIEVARAKGCLVLMPSVEDSTVNVVPFAEVVPEVSCNLCGWKGCKSQLQISRVGIPYCPRCKWTTSLGYS